MNTEVLAACECSILSLAVTWHDIGGKTETVACYSLWKFGGVPRSLSVVIWEGKCAFPNSISNVLFHWHDHRLGKSRLHWEKIGVNWLFMKSEINLTKRSAVGISATRRFQGVFLFLLHGNADAVSFWKFRDFLCLREELTALCNRVQNSLIFCSLIIVKDSQ